MFPACVGITWFQDVAPVSPSQGPQGDFSVKSSLCGCLAAGWPRKSPTGLPILVASGYLGTAQ